MDRARARGQHRARADADGAQLGHPSGNGHAYPRDRSVDRPSVRGPFARFMENWEWTTGRCVDEIGDYLAYALRILKNIGLPCGRHDDARRIWRQGAPRAGQATLQAVRDVYKAEIPHYFRDAVGRGPGAWRRASRTRAISTAPIRGASSASSRAPDDWTGGWDNTPPGGADRFITEDLQSGPDGRSDRARRRAVMLAHWTGIYWNGQELGFKVFQEVVRRLHARFDNLVWMKLSEIARYSAARALTRIDSAGGRVEFRAPFACPAFTFRVRRGKESTVPQFRTAGVEQPPLKRVQRPLELSAGTWCDTRDGRVILSRPAARSIGSGGLSSGSRGNASGASVIPNSTTFGYGLASAKRWA